MIVDGVCAEIGRPIIRETDGQEHFGEEYYSLMNPDFNFFDTMVEAECSGEQASALQDHVFAEVDRFGGGSVMVWGAIRFGWRSPLLIIEGNLTARLYAEIILEGQIIPYCTNDQRSIFMQDNARPHVAEICINLLRNNNVQTLEWPPYSSDMNPIEHLWDTLDRRVRARTPPPQSHAELRQALIEEWHRIPQWRINRLITSMPRRVNALAEARGAHTRY